MYASSPPSGLVWPRLPSSRGAMLRWILGSMSRSERQDPAERQAAQRAQLHSLLSHCARQVPFYRDTLAAAGFRPDRPLTEDIWQRLPLIDRSTVQANAEQLHAAEVPGGHGGVREATTSGSTGIPLRVLKTGLSGLFWDAVTARDHLWQKREFSYPWHSIRYFAPGRAEYPEGARAAAWGRVEQVLWGSGPGLGLSILSDPTEQLEWLRRTDPHYLLTYPSNLRSLLEVSAGQGRLFGNLRQVATVSESLPDGLRQQCSEQWGARICDMYSATEVGYIAIQAPQGDHYLVPDEVVRVELLDDAGRPVGPGEVGRVVVTPLHNFAMPLIRYAIGDYAERGGESPCGRTLPVINRVLGRVRNMLRYPDGRQAWPLFSDNRFREIAPVRQFRIIQHTLSRLEFQLVSERPLQDSEKQSLADLIRERFSYPFEIDVTEHAELARSASGKYEDFRSEVVVP